MHTPLVNLLYRRKIFVRNMSALARGHLGSKMLDVRWAVWQRSLLCVSKFWDEQSGQMAKNWREKDERKLGEVQSRGKAWLRASKASLQILTLSNHPLGRCHKSTGLLHRLRTTMASYRIISPGALETTPWLRITENSFRVVIYQVSFYSEFGPLSSPLDARAGSKRSFVSSAFHLCHQHLHLLPKTRH